MASDEHHLITRPADFGIGAIRGNEESALPLYVVCPHCEHPVVISAAVDGRCYRCRQCNDFYMIQISRPRRQAAPPDGPHAKKGMKKAV